MSLDTYLRLNLAADGELAKALFARADAEAQRKTVPLTPPCSTDGTPAYLTPSMSTWFNAQIQPVRRSALQEVLALISSMPVGNSGNKAKLFEHERDKLDAEAAQKIVAERQLFEHSSNINDVHRKLRAESMRYEAMVHQYGEALKWRPGWYWTVLIFMIFVLEGLINFESFLKIPGFTPALSVGSFIGVSTAFAVSAHFVGVIVKQWKERLGGSISRTEKMKTRMLLGGAAVLFVLAFGFVIYARWALLGDVILRRSQTTGEDIGTEEVVRFAGTLIGNLIVYVMGIIWAYVRHDSIPEFSELRNTVERLQARESSLLDRQLAGRNRRHISKAQDETEKLRRAIDAQSRQVKDYQSGRARFDQLREQDARVVSLLDEYRTLLFEKAEDGQSLSFVFDNAAKVAVETEESLTTDQYSAAQLALRYI